MKKIILLAFIIIASSVYSVVDGQVKPDVPDNANIYDNNIKMRSVELERIKREEIQAEAAKYAPVNTKIEAKFPEIKEDFEGIQVSQSAIVAAYTTGKTIDYAAIESAADAINKKAKRLDSNVFPQATTEKRKEESQESKEKTEKPVAIRDLIVELDNTIGSFVSSKIFANLKVIEPEVAIKTRTDLLKIQELSEKLGQAAKKMK
jgi:hypothetical protein